MHPQFPQAGQWGAGAAPSPTDHTPVRSARAALATDSLGPDAVPLHSAPLSHRSQCPMHPISDCWLPVALGSFLSLSITDGQNHVAGSPP